MKRFGTKVPALLLALCMVLSLLPPPVFAEEAEEEEDPFAVLWAGGAPEAGFLEEDWEFTPWDVDSWEALETGPDGIPILGWNITEDHAAEADPSDPSTSATLYLYCTVLIEEATLYCAVETPTENSALTVYVGESPRTVQDAIRAEGDPSETPGLRGTLELPLREGEQVIRWTASAGVRISNLTFVAPADPPAPAESGEPSADGENGATATGGENDAPIEAGETVGSEDEADNGDNGGGGDGDDSGSVPAGPLAAPVAVNGDGSVTTTETSRKTETVTDETGRTLVVVTETETRVTTDADGTRTSVATAVATATDANGETVVTTTVTTEAEAADGSTGRTVTDGDGKLLRAEAGISEAAVAASLETGMPVSPPITLSPAEADGLAEAPAVVLTLPALPPGGHVNVELAVTRTGPEVVAWLRDDGGGLTLVKDCYTGSVIVPVAGSCALVIAENAKTFSDVAEGAWYAEAVAFVSAREIFNGNGDGTFSPDDTLTYGMVAQMLRNFDPGADPPPEGGGDAVTREALAALLYRYAEAAGRDVSARSELGAFPDAGEVSAGALEAMQWAVGAGLFIGTDGGVLDPGGSATRAQAAAVMQRLVSSVLRI